VGVTELMPETAFAPSLGIRAIEMACGAASSHLCRSRNVKGTIGGMGRIGGMAGWERHSPRHLLKPMSVRLRRVFGFRSCLSLRPLRGRLVTKIRRVRRGSVFLGGLRRSFVTVTGDTFRRGRNHRRQNRMMSRVRLVQSRNQRGDGAEHAVRCHDQAGSSRHLDERRRVRR